jgi:hypothetical protein
MNKLQGGSTPKIQIIVDGEPLGEALDIKTFQDCHRFIVSLWLSTVPRARFLHPQLRNQHDALFKRMDVALDNLIEWTEDLIKKFDENKRRGDRG